MHLPKYIRGDTDLLAKNIKLFRLYNGYTQQQVADILNVDRSTYAYYESGKSVPDIETIIKLARLYNISIDFLLGNAEYTETKSDEESGDKLKDSEPNYNKTSETADETLDESGGRADCDILTVNELDHDERQLIMYFRKLKNKKTVLRLLEALSEKGEI